MKRRPHVLILSSWYPTLEKPFLGNFVEKHCELIAQHYDVTVLDIQSSTSVNSIVVSEKKTPHFRTIIVHYPQSKNPLLKWWCQRKAFNKGVAKIHTVDLIHGNVILPKGLQFIWAKKQYQKPLIVTEHASYFSTKNSQHWTVLQRYILRKVIRNSDIVTAVSPFLAEEISTQCKVKEITLLPNVIDPKIFSYSTKKEVEKTHFLHVSTLDKCYKNPFGILDACENLVQKGYVNFTLEIVSDENYAEFQQLVEVKNLGQYVHFSGPCTPPDIASKMQNSAAFILFSNYETFSCVLAESLATGTPVITTPVGIGKSISAEIGITVAVNDSENLCGAMIQIIEQTHSFDFLKMRAFSADFFPDNVLKTIDSIYSKVLHLK